MNNFLSASTIQACQQASRPSWQRTLALPALVLFAALQCAPSMADEATDVASANATSAPQEKVSWMSGGIGDDARDEMRKAAPNYNVHLLFSARAGNYLADIPFKVSTGNGQEIYTGVSEGPLLYLKLQPGSYQIAAQIDGAWQSKRVQVPRSGAPARISFIAKGE